MHRLKTVKDVWENEGWDKWFRFLVLMVHFGRE